MKYIKFELFKYLYLCNVIFHISTVIKLSSNHLDTFYFTYPLIFFLSLKSHHDFSTSKDLSIRFINVLRQSIAVKFKTELHIEKKNIRFLHILKPFKVFKFWFLSKQRMFWRYFACFITRMSFFHASKELNSKSV